ncbi:ribonuclease H-like domain-containing protein [Tanacetum coccineum]|uniref:Ribonuclease H-like domain-containing protein n=1 Tax=Tanacetum coccineum TaxID=301880 RepID=A0ABQ4XV82_9ASTR
MYPISSVQRSLKSGNVSLALRMIFDTSVGSLLHFLLRANLSMNFCHRSVQLLMEPLGIRSNHPLAGPSNACWNILHHTIPAFSTIPLGLTLPKMSDMNPPVPLGLRPPLLLDSFFWDSTPSKVRRMDVIGVSALSLYCLMRASVIIFEEKTLQVLESYDDRNSTDILADVCGQKVEGVFFRISVTRDSKGMFLSQNKYALELLDRAHMATCNPTRTPVDTESKHGSDGDLVLENPTLQLSSDFFVMFVARWTLGSNFMLLVPVLSLLILMLIGLVAPLLGVLLYCVFLGDNLLSWSSKRQHTLSRSSVEAVYIGVSNAVAESAWLRILLRELRTLLLSATIVYYDTVCVLHVPSRCRYADIFSKGLPFALFEECRTSLSVRSSPAQTAEEC